MIVRAPVLCLVLLAFIAWAVPPRTVLQGWVVRILDGDTVDLLVDGRRTERIRLEGIDAPEKLS